MTNKILLTVVLLIVIIGGLVFYFMINGAEDSYKSDSEVADDEPMPVEPDGGIGDGAEPIDAEEKAEVNIGSSVDGRDIKAYHFGDGDKEVVFVGGIHGGYSWNTALLAYQLIDHLQKNPGEVPDDVKVTVIPAVNPDGLAEVTAKDGKFAASDVSATDAERVAARFNANDVDLNRNFDCEWDAEGTWQNRTVSGGDSVFSEPEAAAVRDYVEKAEPAAVVVWYSAAGGVYSSSCKNGILPATTKMTQVYAEASGYPAHETFDSYEITGDMVNWLASQKIPAISVLLTDYQNTEWSKNQAGIDAVLKYIAG